MKLVSVFFEFFMVGLLLFAESAIATTAAIRSGLDLAMFGSKKNKRLLSQNVETMTEQDYQEKETETETETETEDDTSFRLMSTKIKPTRELSAAQEIDMDGGITSDRDLIVGGVEAPRNRYPYMVSLNERNTGKFLFQCGGTLIAPDMILTAAHCAGAFQEIQVGRYDIQNEEEFYEVYSISHQESHPGWEGTTGSVGDFDVHLIKLLGGSYRYRPVTLNRNPAVPQKAGDQLTVVGWGTTQKGDKVATDILRHVTVDYITNDVCLEIEGENEGIDVDLARHVDPFSICAFDEGEDSCRGDSGGPLLVKGEEDSWATDVQVGVVSYGFDCAHPELPGIYSRVSELEEWINKIVCQHSNDPSIEFGCNRQKVPETGDKILISVEIGMDEYPDETGWFLESVPINGFTTQTYGSRPIMTYKQTTPHSVVKHTLEVENNRQYQFTTVDRFNDGSCCEYGNGYFQITEVASGNILVEKTANKQPSGYYPYTHRVRFTVGQALPLPTFPPTSSNNVIQDPQNTTSSARHFLSTTTGSIMMWLVLASITTVVCWFLPG